MSNETHAGNVTAGRDFVGRDSRHDQSGSAQVHVGADHNEWMTAQVLIIANQLAQVNERLKKLDQIDAALAGNRLAGERGLVEDVRRLRAVVVAIIVALVLIGVVEVAQWILLLQILSAWPN